jgi:hypothetical protein
MIPKPSHAIPEGLKEAVRPLYSNTCTPSWSMPNTLPGPPPDRTIRRLGYAIDITQSNTLVNWNNGFLRVSGEFQYWTPVALQRGRGTY